MSENPENTSWGGGGGGSEGEEAQGLPSQEAGKEVSTQPASDHQSVAPQSLKPG